MKYGAKPFGYRRRSLGIFAWTFGVPFWASNQLLHRPDHVATKCRRVQAQHILRDVPVEQIALRVRHGEYHLAVLPSRMTQEPLMDQPVSQAPQVLTWQFWVAWEKPRVAPGLVFLAAGLAIGRL